MGRFDDFKQERLSSLWPPKQYTGTIVDEYEAAGQGQTFIYKTEDRIAPNGDSRNLRICATLVNNGQVRDMNYLVNYRMEVLTTERQTELKEAQKQYGKVRGRWPDAGAQRDTLSLSRLHDLERGGISLIDSPQGGFETDGMIGKNVHFYVGIERKDATGARKKVTKKEFKETPEDERDGWYNVIQGVNEVEE